MLVCIRGCMIWQTAADKWAVSCRAVLHSLEVAEQPHGLQRGWQLVSTATAPFVEPPVGPNYDVEFGEFLGAGSYGRCVEAGCRPQGQSEWCQPLGAVAHGLGPEHPSGAQIEPARFIKRWRFISCSHAATCHSMHSKLRPAHRMQHGRVCAGR